MTLISHYDCNQENKVFSFKNSAIHSPFKSKHKYIRRRSVISNKMHGSPFPLLDDFMENFIEKWPQQILSTNETSKIDEKIQEITNHQKLNRLVTVIRFLFF